MPYFLSNRFLLLILNLTIISGCIFSQSAPDSLLQKLEHASPVDRPEVLNQIADFLVFDHPEQAVEYAREALEEAQSGNNTQQIIEAFLIIGDGYFYQENYNLAEEYYIRAFEKSKKHDLPDLLAKSHYFLAYLYDIKNDVERAGPNYTRAIEMYDSLGREDMVADLSIYYADLLAKQADNYLAKNYYQKALAVYDSLGKVNDAAETLNSMGLLYSSMGDYEKAVEYYNESMTLMQQIGSKSGVAQAFNNLGILYQNWGNHDEALKYYLESLKLENEIDDKSGIAGAYINIGIVYSEKGDNNKAVDYYERSLAIYEDLDDKAGIATALNNLGDSFKEMGEFDLAIAMLKKALALEKGLEDKYGISLAYVTLSEIYLKAENVNIGRVYNDSAWQLASEIQNPEISIAVYENFYKLYKAEGDYKNALNYFLLLTNMKDSLFNKNLHKQISEVKARYELEQKEQEIALLNSRNKLNEMDIENKKNTVARQRTVLILGGTAFLIILVILLILYRQTIEKKAALITLNEQNKEIQKSREELIVARDKAEESDRLKTIFLANMSHELRTPLNGILGFTEVLRTEIVDEMYREMANIVHNSGNRLLDTLNSIIDLSIIESNRMEIEQNKIDVEELIEETETIFRASAFNKNLKLECEIDSEFTYIITDRKVLVNLLNNLIDNAIKYTRKGHVRVKALVEKNESGHILKIAVRDTGIGIEPDRLKHIFDKFRQGSEGHDRQFEGAGLGLTICKKYTEILHGKIIANSKLNKGSEFIVEIPVDVIRHRSPIQPDEIIRAENIKQVADKSCRLLIVENDDINLKHMVYTLKDEYHIETARTGIEAIEKAGEGYFDIILMDINLGTGPNGMETAKQIRMLDGFEDIPIIAVTANAMKGHKEEFLANGCTHYLAKPFSADDLKRTIVEATQIIQ